MFIPAPVPVPVRIPREDDLSRVKEPEVSRVKDLAPAAAWQEITAAAEDWDSLGAQPSRRMLRHLHLVRAFEETVRELNDEGLVHGPAHISVGQDGAAVAVCSLLDSDDLITGSHRGHHQFVAKGLRHVDRGDDDPVKVAPSAEVGEFLYRSLAEILGLADGFCAGRGGSMHLKWTDAGCMGTNAIVGGGVPFATGLAWAKRRQARGRTVFTFFGDGAVNIGSVTEAMNLAALYDLPVCFFIENNGYALSTSVGEETRETRLSSRGMAYAIPSFRVDGMDPVAVRRTTQAALEIMRAGKGPAIIEALVYRYAHHGGGLPGSSFGYRTRQEEEEWRARDPLPRMAAEMSARGWISEADDARLREFAVQTMSRIASRLTERNGPRRTIVEALWPDPRFRDQGLRGDLSEFREPGLRFEEAETASAPVGDVRFIEAVAQVMNRRMETDERIVVFGEDVHRLKGGTNGATRGLAQRFPDRVIGTPISENGFTGLAGGVAMEGSYRPVVELMFPDFTLVAADQVFNQIAKARHMFGGDTPMPLVARTKVAIGTGYGQQHSLDPAGLYSMWPGWRIVAPSTPFDYVGLMNSALRCEDPVLVIEHGALYSTIGTGPLEDYDFHVPLGKAKVVRHGDEFTVLTYLAMTALAVQVADEMGCGAEVIDLRSLDRAGLDWQTIGKSVRRTNRVVILEQGTQTGSYGQMLSDEIQRRFFDWLDQPVKRIVGGEASPCVSRVLERAAFVGADEVRAGFVDVLADAGRH